MTGVSITYLGDENFLLQLPHRSMTVTTDELLMIRDAITAKLPTEIALRQGEEIRKILAQGNSVTVRRECSDCDGGPDDCHMNCGWPAFERGDYVEATVSVTVDPDTGTYAPAVTEFKTLPDDHPYAVQKMREFALLYQKCKKRGMIE